MIITIDGPAGAGKSSAARALAGRLGFDFLDTGAMYRAVTWACLRRGADPRNPEAMSRLLQDLTLEMPAGRVLVDGQNVTENIRASAVTAASGAVADSPPVRAWMTVKQRELTRGRDMVTEGRDQGTIVFPDAECKFFLTASSRERARRRQQDLAARGEQVELAEVLRAQEERDARDEARAIAPMKPAADARVLDSTGLSLDEVVERMAETVRRIREGT
jgi:cytidylate kinase